MRRVVSALLLAGLAACGDARHEPVRVVAQPRAAVPVAVTEVAPPPAAASVAAPTPAPPASTPWRGLDAPPQPGQAGAQPPARLWQPGEPNGNSEFRAALEARGRASASAP